MESLDVTKNVYTWLTKTGLSLSYNSVRHSWGTMSAMCWRKPAAVKQARDAKKWLPVINLLAGAVLVNADVEAARF